MFGDGQASIGGELIANFQILSISTENGKYDDSVKVRSLDSLMVIMKEAFNNPKAAE
jgi:hypothetical protein